MIDVIIPLLFISAILGIPAALMYRAMKKADSSTTFYAPEEVTRKLRRGFLLTGWGIDFMLGAIPAFALIICDVGDVLKFALTLGSLAVGLILLFVGRFKIGVATRYLNTCRRSRTALEEWVLRAMLGIEGTAAEVGLINAVTRATPGATDDIVAALGSENRDTISSFRAIGKVYTGKNPLLNHWPLLAIVTVVLMSLFITFA